LQIGYDNGSNSWKGGLNDIGIWKTDIAGTFTFATQLADSGAPPGVTEGQAAGGEVGALYNVPMYNGHSGALSDYGVSAMDQLFNLFQGQSAMTAAVTTSNGTLTWQYVPDGTLSGTSGFAGYNAGTGQYFVQLDGGGGGVETVVAPTPEPGTLALLTAGLVGLLAYAWRKRR
jgi:hypothetical protein